MRKNLFVLLVFCLSTFSAQIHAQSPTYEYKYKLGVDIPIATITIGAGVTSLVKQKKNQPFTEAQVQSLVYNANKFDHSSINRNFNKKIHLASDIGMVATIATPLLLLIDKKVRSDFKHIGPMWVETFALTFALTGMTKELVRRTRPYVYYDDVPLSQKMKKDARASFFSGHTSMTASSAFFTAKIYADMNPNSKWKPLVWTSAAVLPAGIGFLRYSGGKHFWTDIITGYIVGAAVGILVPHLHRTKVTAMPTNIDLGVQ
ncbi:MAG TPA: phosphatase PAP2 family protein [Chitinophagales bacterium]|nr:phosphatase PAP2 family protein [Chitinophagales bacterium]